jgi:hypothetical protein
MAIDLERYAEAYRRGLLNEDQNIRLEELERRGLVKLERPPIEQTQQEPLKTIGDINPLYLYLPSYIPVIFLAIFIFLIFKKKINNANPMTPPPILKGGTLYFFLKISHC